jgi:hypothetical protein
MQHKLPPTPPPSAACKTKKKTPSLRFMTGVKRFIYGLLSKPNFTGGGNMAGNSTCQHILVTVSDTK